MSLFYHVQTSVFWYGLNNPAPLIYNNIPREHLGIIFIYGVFLLCSYFFPKIKVHRDAAGPTENGSYFIFVGFMLMSAFAVIFLIQSKHIESHLQTSDRIFLNLTPIGIIAMVLCSIELLKQVKSQKWIFWNLVIVLGGILVMRLLRTYVDVVRIGLY